MCTFPTFLGPTPPCWPKLMTNSGRGSTNTSAYFDSSGHKCEKLLWGFSDQPPNICAASVTSLFKMAKIGQNVAKKKIDQPPTSVLPPSHLCSKPALLWLTPETGCFHNEALCNIWIKKYRATFHLKLKCENKPKWASMMLLAQQPGKKISFASGNLMRCIVAVLTNANTMAASEFDKYKYDCCIWQIQVAQTRFHQSNFVNGHSWRKWAILLESSLKKTALSFVKKSTHILALKNIGIDQVDL